MYVNGTAGMTALLAEFHVCEREVHRYSPINSKMCPKLALPQVGLIIPTLNEEKNLPHLLPRLPKCASFESARINGLSNLRAIPDGMRILRTILRERLCDPCNDKASPIKLRDDEKLEVK
jgi:hypothetical protein